MPNNCSACMNNSRNTRNVSYFSFPRDAVKRRKWLTIIGRDDLIDRIGHLKTAPNHYKVCEEHFESNCFIHNFRLDTNDTAKTTKYKPVKFLSNDALPTLNLRQTKGIAPPRSPLEQCKAANKEVKLISCSYYGCQNTSDTFTMFRFPARKSHRAILAIWLQNAGNKSLTRLSSGQLRNRYLCDAHFDKSYIETGPGRPVLTKDAVPFKTLMVMKPVKVYSKRTRDSDGSPEGSSSFNIEFDSSDESSDDDQSSDDDDDQDRKINHMKLRLKSQETTVQTHKEQVSVAPRPTKQRRVNSNPVQAFQEGPPQSSSAGHVMSDQIEVKVKGEPTNDEQEFKTMLCVEVPPLAVSSNGPVKIKTEPTDECTPDMESCTDNQYNATNIKTEPTSH